MMFGMGSNAELTKKYERVKVQNDIRTSKHIYIYKQTNISNFQLCYPRECLTRFARSPIMIKLFILVH